jgi:hypothetical protein
MLSVTYIECMSVTYKPFMLSVVMLNVVMLSVMAPMNRRLFKFSLIIDGTTGKVLEFVMPLLSIYSKNICFNEQKCTLIVAERFKQ